MKTTAVAFLLSLGTLSAIAAGAACESDASEQARRLLAFHIGDGFQDRMGFESPSARAPIKNPANPKQIFKVLEVEGFVSPHGRYRMRFLYYLLPRGCILMGQEILEVANL